MRLAGTAEWLSVWMFHHFSEKIIRYIRKSANGTKIFDHAQLKPFPCELLEHFNNVYAQWVMDIASHHPIRYISLIHLLESEYELFNQIYQRKLDFSYKFDAVVSHFHFFFSFMFRFFVPLKLNISIKYWIGVLHEFLLCVSNRRHDVLNSSLIH